jgi:hypothetical protein
LCQIYRIYSLLKLSQAHQWKRYPKWIELPISKKWQDILTPVKELKNVRISGRVSREEALRKEDYIKSSYILPFPKISILNLFFGTSDFLSFTVIGERFAFSMIKR